MSSTMLIFFVVQGAIRIDFPIMSCYMHAAGAFLFLHNLYESVLIDAVT
jgi:hypothetical protein